MLLWTGFERRVRSLKKTIINPILRLLRRNPGELLEGPVAMKYYSVYELFWERIWIGDIEEHWHMEKLSVDSNWQRKGIGSMLLKWGLDRAQGENIAAGLDTSI